MKRIILAMSILLVFGLAVAAIAYKRSAVAETASATCCCAGDSCPMKKDGAEHASCCDDGCCKDGSCAMKHSAMAVGEHPDNCPMKDKQTQESHAGMTEHTGESSCCCACCKSKQQV